MLTVNPRKRPISIRISYHESAALLTRCPRHFFAPIPGAIAEKRVVPVTLRRGVVEFSWSKNWRTVGLKAVWQPFQNPLLLFSFFCGFVESFETR